MPFCVLKRSVLGRKTVCFASWNWPFGKPKWYVLEWCKDISVLLLLYIHHGEPVHWGISCTCRAAQTSEVQADSPEQHVLPGLAVAVAVGLGQAVVLLCEDLTADMYFSSDVLEVHAAKVVKYFESCKTGGSTQALPQPGSLRIFNKMAKTAQKRAIFMCRMSKFKKIYT